MSRRLVYVTFGAVVGVLVVRQASSAARRMTPAGLSQRLSDSFGTTGERVADFLTELRLAMAEREQELRTGLGLDGTHDAVDAGL